VLVDLVDDEMSVTVVLAQRRAADTNSGQSVAMLLTHGGGPVRIRARTGAGSVGVAEEVVVLLDCGVVLGVEPL
jgi:hypothetical protein